MGLHRPGDGRAGWAGGHHDHDRCFHGDHDHNRVDNYDRCGVHHDRQLHGDDQRRSPL